MTRCPICYERDSREDDSDDMCRECSVSYLREWFKPDFRQLAWAARRARRYAVKRERAKRCAD